MILTNLVILAVIGAASASLLTQREDPSDPNNSYSDKWPPCTSSIHVNHHNFSQFPQSFTLTDNATGGKAWQDAYTKASNLVAQMTLEEKANLTSGVNGPCAGQLGSVERLGLNFTCLLDGPAGPRPVYGASQFPAGVTTAATWDRDLIYARAAAMGQEFHDLGAFGDALILV